MDFSKEHLSEIAIVSILLVDGLQVYSAITNKQPDVSPLVAGVTLAAISGYIAIRTQTWLPLLIGLATVMFMDELYKSESETLTSVVAGAVSSTFQGIIGN